MNDKKILKITNKDGKEIEYEIILAFQYAETGKSYVIYTDNTKDEYGNLNIYASIYYPDDDSRLDPIETEEEWNIIENMLDNLRQ